MNNLKELHPLVCLLSACVVSEVSFADEVDEPMPVEEHLFDLEDVTRDRIVPVKVYLAAAPADRPQPVVLFSHGLGGSRNGASYLGNHWAGAGYVAVFMQHAGSDERIWRDVPKAERMAAMNNAANARALIDRIGDVSFVLDQLDILNLKEDHPLKGRLNLDKVGMSGHSFGAGTTQAVMGRKFVGGRESREPRLDAFLLLSPSIGKRPEPAEAFGHITMPVMCMTGTNDNSPIDPEKTPESRTEVYAALPPGDKYQLIFKDGHHFVFSDRAVRGVRRRDARCHPAIQRLSTAFWDAYLKEDEDARAWIQSNDAREGLVEADVWEWK